MTLELKKFDLDMIADDKTVVVIGKRGTGKSWITRDILYHKRHIPCGVVMSCTEEGNGFYGKHVPDLFVYGDYKQEVLEKVISRQKRLVHEGHPNPSMFIILDDCAFDKTIFAPRNIPMRTIFMNGRHWKLFFLMTLQWMMDMPPALRQNIDYIFVLKENVIQNKERLWKNFFGVVPDFSVFCEILDNCTQNYECLVLDNTKPSNKIDEVLYWYRAKPRTNFKVGSATFWGCHQKRYNPGYWKAPAGSTHEESKRKKSGVTIHKTK